jgi:hypothetical protein
MFYLSKCIKLTGISGMLVSTCLAYKTAYQISCKCYTETLCQYLFNKFHFDSHWSAITNILLEFQLE